MFFATYAMPTKIDGVGDKVAQIFGKSANGDPKVVGFYSEWSHYLSPINTMISEFVNWLASGIMLGLFKACSAMEQIFTLSFKVICLTDQLTDQSSIAYTFFHGFQIAGLAIAGLIFVVLAVKNITKAEMKYKSYLTNIGFVLIFTAILPWGISQVSSATTAAVNASLGIDDSGVKVTSLSSQPIIENTVDMVLIANNGFRYSLDSNGLIDTANLQSNADKAQAKLDKQHADSKSQSDSLISKVGNFLNDAAYKVESNKIAGTTKLNNLSSDSDILDTNFRETIGPVNGEMIKALNSNQKGAGDIFTHMLDTSSVDKSGKSIQVVSNIKDHKIISGANQLEPVYSRYVINWAGVYAQLLILIVMFLSMSIRVVKSGFDIIIMGIISPWVGLRSLASNRKYKELLMAIEGAFASMIMNIVVLKIMMLIMNSAPKLVSSTELGSITKVIFNIVIYLGAFFGAFQGIGYIERFTGVSQGHSEGTQQLLGAAGLGVATGAGIMGAGRMAANGVANTGHVVGGGINRMTTGAKGLAGAVKSGSVAEKLGGLANTAVHPVQAAKNKGQEIREGISNSVNGFKENAHEMAANNKQGFSQAFSGGGKGNNSSDVPGTTDTGGLDNSGKDGLNGVNSTDGQDGKKQGGLNGINGTSGQDGKEKGGVTGSNVTGKNGGNGNTGSSGLNGATGLGQNGNTEHGPKGEHGQNGLNDNNHQSGQGLASEGGPEKEESTVKSDTTNTNPPNPTPTPNPIPNPMPTPKPKVDGEVGKSSINATGLDKTNGGGKDKSNKPEVGTGKEQRKQPEKKTTKPQNLNPQHKSDNNEDKGIKTNGQDTNRMTTQTRSSRLSAKGVPQNSDHNDLKRSGRGTHFSPMASSRSRASQSMNQIISSSQKSHINGPDVDDDD